LWIHYILCAIFREQVLIPINKPCIYLEGAGRDSTRIEWNAQGNATFRSNAQNTLAKGITFMVDYLLFMSKKNYGIIIVLY
jgi:pectinesterase